MGCAGLHGRAAARRGEAAATGAAAWFNPLLARAGRGGGHDLPRSVGARGGVRLVIGSKLTSGHVLLRHANQHLAA